MAAVPNASSALPDRTETPHGQTQGEREQSSVEGCLSRPHRPDDGCVSTLALLFATAYATKAPHIAFPVCLGSSVVGTELVALR